MILHVSKKGYHLHISVQNNQNCLAILALKSIKQTDFNYNISQQLFKNKKFVSVIHSYSCKLNYWATEYHNKKPS